MSINLKMKSTRVTLTARLKRTWRKTRMRAPSLKRKKMTMQMNSDVKGKLLSSKSRRSLIVPLELKWASLELRLLLGRT